MFLLRVALPDRPGSLGAVASAMGQVQADINAVEVVEKYEGYAVDDFMVELPPGAVPDSLVTACRSIDGVEVLWMSFWPNAWGLQADVDVLNDMAEDPDRAPGTLTEHAPAVFHADWSVLVAATTGRVLARGGLAPDQEEIPTHLVGDSRTARIDEWPEQWLPGWPETLIALAPLRDGSVIVIARKGGPEFLASELARLRHMAALAT